MIAMNQAFLYSLIVLNIVTFLVYGIDKWKAKQGSWRISEATLLILAVIGGSIGALIGMKVWHHKTMHKGGVRDVDNIVEGTRSRLPRRDIGRKPLLLVCVPTR
jgi:uncharacterized membrane protein YsdA (DUF1294 family)